MRGTLTILGGGPAGLGAAYYAARAGIPFVLLERASEVGGLCRTFRCGEHRYDSGAHRFHDRDAEITADVRALCGDDLRPVDAPSAIFDRGRFVDFPPTPLNVLASCRPGEMASIAWEILRARTGAQPPAITFADFAERQFGATLARRFLLGYSEKVWGLPASELAPEVSTRRLAGMTLTSLLLELLAPRRKTEHIDGAFLYPRLGYGEIVERLAAALPRASVRVGREVVGVDVRERRIRGIRLADGSTLPCDGPVLSTIPLTTLARLLGAVVPASAREAAAGLRFRDIRLVFLRLRQPGVSRNASIYLPDRATPISRLHEPKNRSEAMAPPEETALVVEVPCFPAERAAGLSDDDLATEVIRDLARLGLVDPSRVIEWRHHFLPSAYPVYSLDAASRTATVVDSLGIVENLFTIGRAGRFFYSHLHDQLRFGRDFIAGLGR